MTGRSVPWAVLLLIVASCAAQEEALPRLVSAPVLPEAGRVLDLSWPRSHHDPLSSPVSPSRSTEERLFAAGSENPHPYFVTHVESGPDEQLLVTRVDAPRLLVPGRPGIDRIAAGELIGPAVVVDIRERMEQGDPDQAVTVEDLVGHEEVHGPIPAGAIVLMLSGWDSWRDQVELYVNADRDGELRFPGFSLEAVEFLIRQRDIRAVGVDTLSIDQGLNTDLDAHRALLGAGKYAIENLRDLSRLPAAGATLIVAPGAVREARWMPARVLAVIPR